MMIIDIRKLNAQKKYVGSMELEYSAPETLIEIPYVKFSAPVKISFDYEIFEDDSVEIRGTVSYRLEGQCSRCLKAASQEVVGELDALFECKKDFSDYGYTNGVLNLTKAVEDAIMASMPFSVSCGEDCEGISYLG
ncbi:MAG: hypothetical protein E7364_03385 [Clostridiales bacterium]|nr:hypothetical protein [Clostridiales bacterium]MBQ3019914.1 DUF177 domain-containing protein [Clostridia bacterium]